MSASSRRLNDPAFLLGYWPLNNTPADSSGHDRDMTWNGTAAYAFSPFGRAAAELNGTVYLQNASAVGNALGNGISAISVAIWARVDAPGANDGIISIGAFAGAFGMFEIAAIANTFRCIVNAAIRVTPAYTRTQWTHIAMTYDGATLLVYQDGKLLASASFVTTLNCAGRPTSLGAYVSATYLLDGGLANGRVYNVSLTGDEVATLARRRM